MGCKIAKSVGRTPRSEAAAGLLFGWLLLLALLAGCSARHYRESADQAAHRIIREKQQEALDKTEPFVLRKTSENELRKRLLLGQDLPFTSPASLGADQLRPAPHWPKDAAAAVAPETAPSEPTADSTNGVLVLSLEEALRVAAKSSRSYQDNKEAVFRSALDLDLERDRFRASFAGLFTGTYQHDRTGLRQPGGEVRQSVGGSAGINALQRLKSGAQISVQLGWDLLRLLEPDTFTSRSLLGDASISIPLLRGAGRHIVAEPLTQAERDVVYAIYQFERFKGLFAVNIASEYLSVLQSSNEVKNAAENYRGLIASTRRARRLLDAGDLPPIQVDQSLQEELSARNRWVSARESFARDLDAFKVLLGLPADARIALDGSELERLADVAAGIAARADTRLNGETNVPPADAPITLQEPSAIGAGPLEMDPEKAIRLALENRLDLRVAQGEVYDTQRRVVIAANALKPELTLFGNARVFGESARDLDPSEGSYDALLSFEPPFERTAEAINYRNSYITLERSVRALQALEDEIKLEVRDRLRALREARESLRIQALAVELAERRVRGADLNLQAGRVEIRDLLEAQEDLLSARNALTAATVNYRVAELQLQRDLGVLEVNAEGLWKEFQPGEQNERANELDL